MFFFLPKKPKMFAGWWWGGQGINRGLDVKGIGTFKFKIKGNNGKKHRYKFQTVSTYLS
jgi:hypothetical protein